MSSGKYNKASHRRSQPYTTRIRMHVFTCLHSIPCKAPTSTISCAVFDLTLRTLCGWQGIIQYHPKNATRYHFENATDHDIVIAGTTDVTPELGQLNGRVRAHGCSGCMQIASIIFVRARAALPRTLAALTDSGACAMSCSMHQAGGGTRRKVWIIGSAGTPSAHDGVRGRVAGGSGCSAV
jgi:hypothetical protein